VSYELLQRAFYVDFGGTRPSGSEQYKPAALLQSSSARQENPDLIGGFRAALPILNGIETKFGLSLPRFRATVTAQDLKSKN
jgi:solute carrier family 25 aspartate/glutamate transporter 12/13